MATNQPGKSPDRLIDEEAAERIRHEVFHGVGYRQPPKSTRFQKGQSGNPKGRPRGNPPDLSLSDQPTLQAVLRASKRPVRMREGDKVTEVPSIDAVIQATVAAALKGNARSQGLAIDLARTAEQAYARDIRNQNEVWTLIKARQRQLLDEAMKRGESARAILPHPDDIIIDPESGPRFVGPLDEAEQKEVDERIACCETLLMEDALELRTDKCLSGEAVTEPGSALYLFILLQRTIPERLRLSTIDTIIRQGRYQGWPKRKLIKEIYLSWKKLGRRVPRGRVRPNLTATRSHFEFRFELFTEGLAGRVDMAALERGEIHDNVRVIAERHGIEIRE